MSTQLTAPQIAGLRAIASARVADIGAKISNVTVDANTLDATEARIYWKVATSLMIAGLATERLIGWASLTAEGRAEATRRGYLTGNAS